MELDRKQVIEAVMAIHETYRCYSIEEFARAFADRLCGPEKPKGWYWDENWLRDENGAPILNNMDGRKLTPLEKAMFANAWRLWLAVSNPKYREANSMIAADIRREAGE